MGRVGLIVLDGALGTLLEARGVPTPAPLWSAWAVRGAPEALAAIHTEYATAGATVHTAATFRTTPRAAGGDADALTREAVAITRASVPHGHRVAGSLAPIEDCWHPERSPVDAYPLHLTQAERLAWSGVDLLLVETFANVRELVDAVAAARTTGLPVWASLSPGYDGSLLTPSALAVGALRAAGAGASVVLVNCLPAASAAAWVRALAGTGLPWGVYANAGPTEDGLQDGTPGADRRYAEHAARWLLQGAQVVGGCCGVGPAAIKAVADLSNLRQAVDGATDDS